jgi:N-methyl-L-tryptophan oxidase
VSKKKTKDALEATMMDAPLREPDSNDEQDLRQFSEKHFPAASGPILSMQTAFFEHFARPSFHHRRATGPGAWVIAGLSGHGFKYASALGELAKDLVVERKSAYDLKPFRLERF